MPNKEAGKKKAAAAAAAKRERSPPAATPPTQNAQQQQHQLSERDNFSDFWAAMSLGSHPQVQRHPHNWAGRRSHRRQDRPQAPGGAGRHAERERREWIEEKAEARPAMSDSDMFASPDCQDDSLELKARLALLDFDRQLETQRVENKTNEKEGETKAEKEI
ncbi:hypothetical protein MKZ38_001772 [Zalerion maritima]|uniref:Uncharacterized protein n=1 Tax=Zalerion maritima TaxID=339359 RepID=A0AAD5RYY2_9PEZI|nr:hypothetical protein MKZ38_001772 [Zalerion maritima]